MSRTQGNLAALSRFVFRTPDWSLSLFVALLVAAIAGIAAFDSRFMLDDAGQGIFYIGVPTVVAVFLTPPLDRRLGGQLTYNRSALLAVVCEMLLVVVLVGAAVVAAVSGLGQRFIFDALLVGLASIFAVRLFVVVAVSRQSLPVAVLPASVQTVAGAAMLFVYGGMFRELPVSGATAELFARADRAPAALSVVTPRDFLVLGVVCGIYAAAVGLFVVAIDRPWRRSLGVSVLDFVAGFIGHIAEDSRELEEFFTTLGETCVVPVTVCSIRRLDDGTEKARFVLPTVHPGPMGDIGGGNLPERIAESTDGLAFPPHATAGHDFNLVSEREVDRLLEAAEDAVETIEYGPTASRGIRTQEGDSKLLGQAIGDGAFVTATHAPAPADDVAFSVGLSTAAEIRSGGIEDVLLVDAHNCNDGLEGEDLGHVSPGSQRSVDMMTAGRRLGEMLAAAERHQLSVGVAAEPTDWTPSEGIGPLGVRAAVFEVDGHRTAYVLVDGNNMEPGVRERLLESIPTEEAEVLTTDTHVVNTMEATNQVGDAVDVADLSAVVSDVVEAAIEDVECVEAGIATRQTEVTVFGNDRTETLASTANAMIGMGGAFAVVVVGAAVVVSLLVFLFV
ncbi:MAG: DUF2070 family protein [Natronomonas sp.]